MSSKNLKNIAIFAIIITIICIGGISCAEAFIFDGGKAQSTFEVAQSNLTTAKNKTAEAQENLLACVKEAGFVEQQVNVLQEQLSQIVVSNPGLSGGPVINLGILESKIKEIDAALSHTNRSCDQELAQFQVFANEQSLALNRYEEAKAKAQEQDSEYVSAQLFKNALHNLSQQIAYETATWVASGGKGQQPLFITEGWGAYMQDLGDQALGGVIDDFMTRAWDLNVCEPDFDVKLSIIAGINYTDPQFDKPRCSFSAMVENWSDAVQNPNFVLEYKARLNPKENDIGTALLLRSEVIERQKEVEKEESAKLLANGFFKSVTDYTDRILTPGSYVKEALFKAHEDPDNWQEIWTGTGDAVETFLNTLTAKLFKTYVNGFFKVDFSGSSGSSNSFGNNFSGIYNPTFSPDSGGEAGARDRFSNFVESELKVGSTYDILNELVVCPLRTDYKPGPTDCVIDPLFASAVREMILIKDLSSSIKNRPFAPALEESDNPQTVFTLRNVMILRKYRIVPVGWEIAAKYITQYGERNYTLGELMDKFDDDGSEFYGLVDPYWVLKAPELFCRREGYGPNLFDTQSNTISRIKYCADEQQCIAEDEDGNCTAFGYCTEEKRTWNFNGKKCDPIYNTCETFQTPSGSTISYLANTLDYRDCSLQNAGCIWYSTTYNPVNNIWTSVDVNTILNQCNSTSGCFVNININIDYGHSASSAQTLIMNSPCLNVTGCDFNNVSCTIPYQGVYCVPEGEDVRLTFGKDSTNSQDIFFDRDVQFCDASAGGCSQFIRTEAGLSSNLIPNSDFSLNKDADNNTPDGWDISSGEWDNGAVKNDTELLESIIVYPSHYYYISASAALDPFGDEQSVANIKIGLCDDQNNCNYSAIDGTCQGLYESDLIFTPVGFNFERNGCWFRVGGDITKVNVKLTSTSAGSNPQIWFDDIKLEEITYNQAQAFEDLTPVAYSSYSPSQRSASQLAYLKYAPDYYNCYLSANSWPENSTELQSVLDDQDNACQDYAQVCTQDEVGCQFYIPVNGDPAIPGKISSNDLCPGECVGYQVYKQEETNFTSERFTQFIADSTPQYCSAGSAGCDEFTNLDEVASGGEARDYYIEISACQKPDGVTNATYYTWEGSDTTGYQLKVYEFKKSATYNQGQIAPSINPSAPCTELAYYQTGHSLAGDNYCNDLYGLTDLQKRNATTYSFINDAINILSGVNSLSDYLDHLAKNPITNNNILNQTIVDGLHEFGVCAPQELTGYFYFSQKWAVGSSIATASSGLISGTTYSTSVLINGDEYNISFDGGVAQSYQDVINELNDSLTAQQSGVEVIWNDGFIEFEGDPVKSGTTITILDNNLFSSLSGTAEEAEDLYVSILSNPDCREFYDVGSNISHRLLSRTVTISDDCHPYRRTPTQPKDASQSCPALGVGATVSATQCDCVSTGGYWNASNECIYMIIPQEGVTCSSQYAGCREYTGNQGNNIRNIITDDFEFGPANWEGGILSLESSYPGGSSLKTSGLLTKEVYLRNNKSYHLSFWAKSDTDFNIDSIKFSGAPSINENFAKTNLIIRSSWQRYDLGPVFMTWADDGNQTIEINTGGNTLYIDSIILKESQNNVYLIENSWFTPFSCDNKLGDPDGQELFISDPNSCDDITGNPLLRCSPGEMLGCSAYDDENDQRYNLRSFEKLCREDAVGCEGLIDTYNSDYPFTETFNGEDTSTCVLLSRCANGSVCPCYVSGVTAPVCNVNDGEVTCQYGDDTDDIAIAGDTWVYLVNRSDVSCSSVDKGCTAYGLPEVSYFDEVVDYQTVYLKNQPDRYFTDLCEKRNLWCDEFISDNTSSFFKDPRGKLCEYKNHQDLGPNWYIQGLDITCETSAYQTLGQGSVDAKIQPIGWFDNRSGGFDTFYNGWAGVCPSTKNTCTEFIDPLSVNYSNILFNGDFEQGGNGWTGFLGTVAGTADSAKQDIELKNNTLYTVSADVIGTASTITTIDIFCGVLPSPVGAPGVPTIMWSPDASMARTLINTPSNVESAHYNMKMERYGSGSISGRFYIESPFTCSISINNGGIDSSNSSNSIDNVRIVPTGVYYYLANKIDDSSCNGLVDYYGGCVLFNNRGDINYQDPDYTARVRDNYLIFDADATGSVNEPKAPVSKQKNANTILKVQPDRDCSSWLYCSTYIKGDEDSVSSQFGAIDECLGLGLCSHLDVNSDCDTFDVSVDSTVKDYDLGDVNKTGYIMLGDNINGQDIEGLSSFETMTELGSSANVANGNFEFMYGDTTEPLGWIVANSDDQTSKWYDYKYKIETNKLGRRNSFGYLRLNSAYEVKSELIEVEPDTEYVISGWINTLDLYPQSQETTPAAKATAKILVQELQSNGENVYNSGLLVSNYDQSTILVTRYGELEVKAGNPWTYVSKKIKTKLNTRSIRLRLQNYLDGTPTIPGNYINCSDNDPDTYCQLSGHSFFDDIMIKPILNIRTPANSQDDYVSRDCRAYPEQSSHDCSYAKDDNIYYGWHGYCLLRDPQNSDVCLQWWPVDRISGDEVDEFLLSYQGDVPLYYCVNQKKLIKLKKGWDDNQHSYDGGVTCGDECSSGFTFINIDINGVETINSSRYTSDSLNLDPFGSGTWTVSCSCGGCDWTGSGCDVDLYMTYNGGDNLVYEDENYQWYDLPITIPFFAAHKGTPIIDSGNEDECVQIPYYNNYDNPECWTNTDAVINVCNELAQTVTSVGVNKAWTTRVDGGSKQQVKCLDGDTTDFCQFQDALSPFGSVNPLSPSHNPTQWRQDGALPLLSRPPEELKDNPGYYWQLFADPQNESDAKQSLWRIFAKSYGVWQWEFSECVSGFCSHANNIECNTDAECFNYHQYKEVQKNWDVPTVECSPLVRQKPADMNDEYCYIKPEVDYIKFNDGTDSTIVDNNKAVKLSFNVFVDPDQLPLTSYRVDWGDKTQSAVSGVNLRSRVNADNTFELYHFYDYWQMKDRGANCSSTECQVRATISVRDNWGQQGELTSGIITVKP